MFTATARYDKEVVSSLVELIIHFGGPALLVAAQLHNSSAKGPLLQQHAGAKEPDNVARQQLGSVQYFEEPAAVFQAIVHGPWLLSSRRWRVHEGLLSKRRAFA